MALKGANARLTAGELTTADQVYQHRRRRAAVATAAEVGSVVVASRGGAPVYLRNVADVADGFGETTTYVSHENDERRVRGGGHDRRGQAKRRECDGGHARGAAARRRGEGTSAAARRAARRDARLRRDSGREGARAHPAPGASRRSPSRCSSGSSSAGARRSSCSSPCR